MSDSSTAPPCSIEGRGRVLLVTGATGMVGSAAARRGVELGYRVRCMVRDVSSGRALGLPDSIDWVAGDLLRPETLPSAVAGAELVVHAAAKVGDWGPIDEYRAANVVALEHLLTAARESCTRWVQISSLGVYPAQDHHGTEETSPIDAAGRDGYTRSKAEAEQVLGRHIAEGFPAVILRPGFIYGPGDRHVLPRLMERVKAGKMAIFGDGMKLMNNTSVDNLVHAVFLALNHPAAVGQTFNIRDPRLVTKVEFVHAVCDFLHAPYPRRIPLGLARRLARLCDFAARALRRPNPPPINWARFKFLGLNLDFSISKAQRLLGYSPSVDFTPGFHAALVAASEQAK